MSGMRDEQSERQHARRWRSAVRNRWTQDLVVTAVPIALAIYQGLAQPVEDLGAHGRAAYITAGALSALPLLLRRVAPLLTVGLVTGVIVLGPAAGIRISNSMLVALALACYSQGCYDRRRSAAAGWVIALAYPAGWVWSVPPAGRRDFVLAWGAVILVVNAWLALASYAGHIQRQRVAVAAELARESLRVQDRMDAVAALDVARERARLAADLQLIARNAVEQLRVGAANAAVAVRDRRRNAAALLDDVAEGGRRALVEMRRLLGVLRADADTPGEDSPQDVQRWTADAAARGVSLALHGREVLESVPLAPVAAARRTVEVATIIARHGEGRVSVAARLEDGELRVSAVAHTRDGGTGAGDDVALEVERLRERLRLTGGRLSVEHGDGATVLESAVPVERVRVAIPPQHSPLVPDRLAADESWAAPEAPVSVPRRTWRRDLAIACVLALLGVAEIVFRPDYGHHAVPDELLPGVVVMLVFAALVLVRDRWTWLGFAVVAVLTAVVGFDVVRFSGALHVVIAMYLFTIASRSSLRTSLGALGVISIAHLPVLVRLDFSCLCIVVVLGIAGSATAIGRVARRRDELNALLAHQLRELEDHRERRAELAVAEERRRVAREMHDVVAHRLSVAVLQAGAAAGVVEHDRQQAGELLAHVTEAVDALSVELSSLADVADGGAPADAFDVSSLVEEERRLGREMHFVLEPVATPTPGVRLVAYRIVQEALTNARKHAADSPVSVRVHEGEGGVEVVIDTAQGAGLVTDLVQTGGGHGLRGMRERAAVVGGRVDAGPTDDAGFRVRAWLPEAARV